MSPSEPEGHAAGTETEGDDVRSARGGGPRLPRVLILDDGPGQTTAIAKAVEAQGVRIAGLRGVIEAASVLRRTRPDLAVVALTARPDDPDVRRDLAEFRQVARELGIPLLDVVSPVRSLARVCLESRNPTTGSAGTGGRLNWVSGSLVCSRVDPPMFRPPVRVPGPGARPRRPGPAPPLRSNRGSPRSWSTTFGPP